MKATSLSSKGLSLSQAQSISNLCNQAAATIEAQLSNINNCSKSLKWEGELLVKQRAKPMPSNVVELLTRKALLYATQAFLMENIKAKDAMLKQLKQKKYESVSTVVLLELPARPVLTPNVSYTAKPLVDEAWGWEQLSVSEMNEYYEQEALAAHIGQFIHKSSTLNELRKELETIPTLEWEEKYYNGGTKSVPLVINVHHTPEQLLQIHNELATLHRKYEQRVNYYKAKVKNLVSDKNNEIATFNVVEQQKINQQNQAIDEANRILMFNWKQECDVINKLNSDALAAERGVNAKLLEEFEAQRQQDLRTTSALRIQVDSRFKSIIDEFLSAE